MRVCRHRMSTAAAVEEWKAAAGRKVFVTRLVPSEGVDLLKSAGCVVTQWDNDVPIPRDELLKGVHGCDALFCMLTDCIDKQVLDVAGLFLLLSQLTNIILKAKTELVLRHAVKLSQFKMILVDLAYEVPVMILLGYF